MEFKLDVKFNASKVLNPLRIDKSKMNEAVGQKVADTLTTHLQAFDESHPNKLGGVRTHFYYQASKAVSFTSDEQGATVNISGPVGLRQRFQGGTITAKNAHLLTIPAIPEAYGHKAGDFLGLRFVRFGKKGDTKAPMALVEAPAGATSAAKGTKIKGRKAYQSKTGHKARVFFWLKESVTQVGDPDVLPTIGEIEYAAYRAMRTYIETLPQKQGPDVIPGMKITDWS